MNCEIKYAPKKLDDLIYPNIGVERRIKGYASKQLEGHIILYGPNGTGKSTLAQLLVQELVNHNPEF
jgi:replication-associated recombination protein RarA